MQWWQIVLIVGGAVAAGLGVGYVLNNLVVRIASALGNSRKRVRRPIVPPGSPAQAVPSVPDLYAEIEYNRRLATDQWEGQLKPFQTRVWDNRGDEVHSLPVEVRNTLTEAYSDMALANSITWLSTEMSRRSPSLDESYAKLRASISTRLNQIRLQLADLPAPTRSGSTQ